MRLLAVCLLSLLLLTACTANPEARSASASTQPHAECLVCKVNADLACVDVTVDKATPQCVCDGKTYYFCSEECRAQFEKNPAKYVRR